MNVKTAKKPESRVGVGYSQQFKMQTYGEDNLYPQNLLAITSASGTARLCLNRYAKFIEGFGFKDTNFSEYVLNKKAIHPIRFYIISVKMLQGLRVLLFM